MAQSTVELARHQDKARPVRSREGGASLNACRRKTAHVARGDSPGSSSPWSMTGDRIFHVIWAFGMDRTCIGRKMRKATSKISFL